MNKVEVEILLDGGGETRYYTYDVPNSIIDTNDIKVYIEEQYGVLVGGLIGISPQEDMPISDPAQYPKWLVVNLNGYNSIVALVPFDSRPDAIAYIENLEEQHAIHKMSTYLGTLQLWVLGEPGKVAIPDPFYESNFV